MSQPIEQETNKCAHSSPEECLQQSPTQYYLYCLPHSMIGDRVNMVPQGEPEKRTGRVAARRLQRLAEIFPEKAAAKALAAEFRPLQYSLVKDEEAAAQALRDSLEYPIEITPEPVVEKEVGPVVVNPKPTKTQRKRTSRCQRPGGGGGSYRGR